MTTNETTARDRNTSEIETPSSDIEPVASNVRGAADWLLYYYAEPAHQGEDDQTAAAYWALGDDLAGKLIDAFTELARLRALAGVPDQTADRAAIQRVEAVLDRHETRAREMSSAFGTTKGVRTPAWVNLVRRALDGDTTEEER